jgi:hypothetical protein
MHGALNARPLFAAQAQRRQAREDVMTPSFRDASKTGPGIHNLTA